MEIPNLSANSCVSIQLLFRWNSTFEEGFEFKESSFNTTVVSVEYAKKVITQDGKILFQYNCCFGGIVKVPTVKKTDKKFQYYCCFGGMFLWKFLIYRLILAFQYNCCFGGIFKRS